VALANIFDVISLFSFVITILMMSMSAFVYALHGVKQFRLLETLNSVDPRSPAHLIAVPWAQIWRRPYPTQNAMALNTC